MKELKRDLQFVVKDLKLLTQKTEEIAKELDKLEKAKAPVKPGAKAKAAQKAVPKKAKRVTNTDTVLSIIKRSRKGIDTATLGKKTGFKDNNIRAILSRLKKHGKIKSEVKGIYVKA